MKNKKIILPPLIGISGKKASGKSITTSILCYLIEYYKIKTEKPTEVADKPSYEDYKLWKNNSTESLYIEKQFAKALKQMLAIALNVSVEKFEDREWKNTPLGPEWWKIKTEKGIKPYTYKDMVEARHPIYEEMVIRTTPRMLLQELGTNAGQLVHPNFWVNTTFATYEPFEEQVGTTPENLKWVESMPNWIISDVRFPHEAEAIKDRGGILIRCKRNPICPRCGGINTRRKMGGLLCDGKCNTLVRQNPYTPEELHKSELALDEYEDWDIVVDNNKTFDDLIEQLTSQIDFKINEL